jgi:2-polyprenyl-3-methyl-5-hydroxy-6-metoxy-1,4-benzoquinol methylase
MLNYFKPIGKFFRMLFTFWVRQYDLKHLSKIRFEELKHIINFFPRSSKTVLELGAGTGWQSKILSENNYEVKAIDLPSSTYKSNRVWILLITMGIQFHLIIKVLI